MNCPWLMTPVIHHTLLTSTHQTWATQILRLRWFQQQDVFYSFMFDFISILFSWETISESATFSDNHQYLLWGGPFFAPLERSTHWVPVKGWILKNTLFWGLTRGHGVQFLLFIFFFIFCSFQLNGNSLKRTHKFMFRLKTIYLQNCISTMYRR